MEPVPINRFKNGTGSDKPVWKLNRFIKKPVLEPVYETGLPALIFRKAYFADFFPLDIILKE